MLVHAAGFSWVKMLILKDDKKSSADPSEYKDGEERGDSDFESEDNDSPICESPCQPVYAKSNAVKGKF